MLSIRRMLARRSITRPASRSAIKARPSLESLESRLVLYTATGNMWPHPQLITISFMPDGTNLGGVNSNLVSTFNSNPRLAGQWQNVILKAAQVWAQQTNINFAVVPDNGAPWGGGNYEQGDPGYGDIRIGGYAFGSSTLGWAYQPPSVNNFSIAGDIFFNTGQKFSIGSPYYDLFTVAAHEIGHALGLGESTTTSAAVMYGTYNGVKSALNSDDISGIQSIYGGSRSPDAYNSGGASDGTFTTAANLNALINTTTDTALVQNLNLNTAGQSEYFTVNAPSGTASTLTLNVQSSGLSLLSPKVTVYASDEQTVLGSASGLNQYGTTLTVTIPNVYSGEQFYIKVQGADSTAFSTGNYAMTLNFGTGASPTVPLPNTTTPDGNPITGGGGSADSLPGHADAHHPQGPMIFGAKGRHGHHHSPHPVL
jgi:Matrixin